MFTITIYVVVCPKYAEINLETLFIWHAFQGYGVKEDGHDLLTTRFVNKILFLLCMPLECHTTLHLICTLQTFTVQHEISPVFYSLVQRDTQPHLYSPV